MADSWRDNWELAFPSKYLGAQHMHGRDVTVTISKVDLPAIEMFDQNTQQREKKRKLTLSFEELANAGPDDPEFMIVNKTNGRLIAGMYGPAVDGWVGKRITLYPTTVKVGKEIKPCLRVRPTIPPEKGSKTSSRAAQSREGSANPPGEPATAPHAGPSSDHVRKIFDDLQVAMGKPELMASLRKRIDALPDDNPDKRVADRSLGRLERAAREP